MKVKIFLRSVVKNKVNHLALFDSNRNGDIDNLETVVKPGDTIIWKPDCCSGIKSITGIYSNEEEHSVFIRQPKKRLLCKGFKLRLEIPEAKVERREKYTIECILCNNVPLITDPYIRVPPPPPKT